MKKNIAVVGCGHWGKNLVRNFHNIGSLAAIYDSDAKIAEDFSKKFHTQNLSFEEILSSKEIDGVVIAAPAFLHHKLGMQSLNAKKHTYVEKPLAMNNSEAKEMISAASLNNVNLMVGHLLHYHPVFIKIKEIIEKNIIGNINYMYSNRMSFGKVRSEEDVIWSFAPHDISMILSLVDDEVYSIRSDSVNFIQNHISDSSIIHLEFLSGLKAHISVSWCHPYKEQKLIIIGSKGMIVFDDTVEWSKKLEVYPHEVALDNSTPKLLKRDPSYILVDESEPLENECRHFCDVVNKNIKPLTDGYEGLSVLNVLNAASKSHKENKKIKLGKL